MNNLCIWLSPLTFDIWPCFKFMWRPSWRCLCFCGCIEIKMASENFIHRCEYSAMHEWYVIMISRSISEKAIEKERKINRLKRDVQWDESKNGSMFENHSWLSISPTSPRLFCFPYFFPYFFSKYYLIQERPQFFLLRGGGGELEHREGENDLIYLWIVVP